MVDKGDKPWIIIVGAGPAGLVLALLLGQKKIPVRVVEMAHELDSRPRATHYSAPANHELRRAGLMDEILQKGFIPGDVAWRKLDGTYLAGMNNLAGNKDDSMACLPLDQLGQIVLRELLKQPTVQLSWGHKVVGVGQDDDGAWVDIEVQPDAQTLQLKAQYVVGCDGANSQVRKSLFGKSFPGFTWDEQIVATNVSSYLASPERVFGLTKNDNRRTTHSKSMATETPTLSFTPSTGTWPHASPVMECGA